MAKYETTIATVTDEETGREVREARIWDVYSQSWRTWRVDEVPDHVLASLPESDRERIAAAR